MLHRQRFEKAFAAMQNAQTCRNLADRFGEKIKNVLLAFHAPDYHTRKRPSEGEEMNEGQAI